MTKDPTQQEIYKECNGTSYSADTPQRLVELLESLRASKTRVRVTYGDRQTGEPWPDLPECGHISRSTGSIKIPILVKNARSTGGAGLLASCIVKIEHANKKDGGTIYAFPH